MYNPTHLTTSELIIFLQELANNVNPQEPDSVESLLTLHRINKVVAELHKRSEQKNKIWTN